MAVIKYYVHILKNIKEIWFNVITPKDKVLTNLKTELRLTSKKIGKTYMKVDVAGRDVCSKLKDWIKNVLKLKSNFLHRLLH